MAPDQLYEGRYLVHTIDFRNVYAECLNRVLGLANPGLVMPGYGRWGLWRESPTLNVVGIL